MGAREFLWSALFVLVVVVALVALHDHGVL